MNPFQTILACLTGSDNNTSPSPQTPYNEKPPHTTDIQTAEHLATKIVQTLITTEKTGRELKTRLDDIVSEYGWTEKIAEWTLHKLEAALTEASKLGPALKEAYDTVCEVAKGVEGFVQDHPVFCTVIALGVLVVVAPWVVEALGFGELGPIEGTFASAWQVRYAGYVPKGSLFSFFQRLGMVWHP